MTATRDVGSSIITLFILLASMALYLLLDLALAVSLNSIISGGFAVTVLALSLLLLDPWPAKRRLLVAGVLVSAVFAVRYIDWDGRKPFLRDFNQIQLGMTAEEVDEVMADYTKLASPFAKTSLSGAVQMGAITYQHSTENRLDVDLAHITFAGGHVIAATFYPCSHYCRI